MFTLNLKCSGSALGRGNINNYTLAIAKVLRNVQLALKTVQLKNNQTVHFPNLKAIYYIRLESKYGFKKNLLKNLFLGKISVISFDLFFHTFDTIVHTFVVAGNKFF